MIIDAVFMLLRLAATAATVVGILFLIVGLFKGMSSKNWKLFIRGLYILGIGIAVTIVTELGWGMYQLQSYEGTPFEKAQRGLNQAPIEQPQSSKVR